MKTIKLIALGLFTSFTTMSYGQDSNLLLEARNALLADSTEKFLTLLDKIPDVNKPIKGAIQEWTILHAACSKVNTKAVKAILAKGFKNINDDKNKTNSSPLLAIKCLTQEDMMKSMVDGYELKVKQMENDPELKKRLAPYLVKPSTNVADYGDPSELAKILIDAGADVNMKDGGNATLLHRAIYAGNPKLVKLLLDSKADLEKRHGMKVGGKQFPTPLHCAAMKDNSEIIKLLVAAGADTKAELKEYVVDASVMRQYGYTDYEISNANSYIQYLKVNNTPYSLAKVFKKQNSIKTFEELGINK